VHNFARESQNHWHKNFLPHIRYVATIPCESLRHKSNTFHTILALCTRSYRSHVLLYYCLITTGNVRACRMPCCPVFITLLYCYCFKKIKHSRKSETQNLCSKLSSSCKDEICLLNLLTLFTWVIRLHVLTYCIIGC